MKPRHVQQKHYVERKCPMELIAKNAELVNGLRLSYAEQGANRGTPLILLPGIADSWRIFEPLLAELTSMLPSANADMAIPTANTTHS
jgi:hypothetical protein